MIKPEPIELENNLGPDAVTGEINRVPWMAYDVDEMDLYIAEKDAEIAELKKKLMPCLNGDCILPRKVVEKYGKENAELKQKLDEKDKVIAELKADYKEACNRLQTVGLIKDEQMAKVAKQREVISSLKCEIVNLERRVYAANRDARRTRY